MLRNPNTAAYIGKFYDKRHHFTMLVSDPSSGRVTNADPGGSGPETLIISMYVRKGDKIGYPLGDNWVSVWPDPFVGKFDSEGEFERKGSWRFGS